MTILSSQRLQIFITAIAAIYVWSLLAWQHFHGGVVSHHILHRSDLPAISNAWGGLVLPVLTWMLVGRVIRREQGNYTRGMVAGFLGALFYGVVLSVSFVNGLEQLYSPMGPGLLLIALFLPIYRAEYVLGFVLSMTYVFGALLPTGFAAVVALIAFVLYRFVRPIPRLLVGLATQSKNTEED
jgi:hypothetical protein